VEKHVWYIFEHINTYQVRSTSLTVTLVCWCFSELFAEALSSGPIVERITGKRIKPWPQPRVTSPIKVTKMVVKISEALNASGRVPRKVEMPPIKTEFPMVVSISVVFSLRVPDDS